MTKLVGVVLLAIAACGDESATVKPGYVVQLDAQRGELPEGLAIDPAGTAYVGLAPTGQVLAIDTATGDARAFGSVPAPPPDQGYLFGLALRGGSLYAAVASSSESHQPGIYKLPEGTLYASHPALRFPNGMALADERMFVSDSLSGAVFSVDQAGSIELWLADPALLGDMAGPCANGAPFPIGVNGLAVFGDTLYAVNSDRGSLLRVAIQPDGSAGALTVAVASDCEKLGGADGLTVDDDGTLYVAANAIDAITRVSPEGELRVIATGLDFPASVALHDGALFVTDAAFKSARTPGAASRPGLSRVALR